MARGGFTGTPKGSGLRPRLEKWFEDNPDEELTAEQVAIKFDVSLPYARNELAIATKGGVLERVTLWRLKNVEVD